MNIVLVMFMAVVQASDLSKLMIEDQANPINEEKFQKFLSFVFRDTYCAEVFIDSSLSSNHLLKVLHKTQGVPSLILYPKKNNSCSDRIYIAINGNNLWPLIRDSPIQGVRFFILLIDSNEELMLKGLKLFQRGNMFFEHSPGYVVHLRHLNQAYKYNLIQKKFFPQNIEDITTMENEHVEDFGGKHIKVATFNCSVHSQVGPLNENGEPEYIGGVELEFFDSLATKLNFTYSIVVPKGDKKIGSIDKSGVWTKYGVIGLVGKKEVDVAFCGIWISSYFLSSALDVTESLNNVCIKFLVPRPGPVIKKGSGLIGPFDMYMWICISISVLTVPYCSRTFAFLVSCLSKWKNSPLIKSYTSYGNVLIRFWGIILANSPRSLETLGPLRYIVCSWALLTSFLGIFYSSSLRSNLLRIKEGVSYDTVQSLVESDLFWSTIYKVDFNYLFNMDEDWHRKWAGRYKMHSIKKQCRLMKEKKVAILASQYNEGVTTYESLPCLEYLNNYKTSMTCVNNLGTAIIFQEKSPYTKTFSKYIKKFQENGCFNRDYKMHFHLLSLKKHYVLEVLDPRARTNKSMLMGIYHLFFVFCLLLFGDIAASLVFLLEIIWYRRKLAVDKSIS